MLMIALAVTLSSCELAGGIFKGGVTVGIIIVLVVVFLVLWLVRKGRR
jgi:hypothetical protein